MLYFFIFSRSYLKTKVTWLFNGHGCFKTKGTSSMVMAMVTWSVMTLVWLTIAITFERRNQSPTVRNRIAVVSLESQLPFQNKRFGVFTISDYQSAWLKLQASMCVSLLRFPVLTSADQLRMFHTSCYGYRKIHLLIEASLCDWRLAVNFL